MAVANSSSTLPDAVERPQQICVFCDQLDDEKRYGPMISKNDITAHNFCLLFSSGLAQLGDDGEGLVGFLPGDILKEKQRSRCLKCAYCKRRNASIGCIESRCKRSFHYGCGKDHGATYIFSDNFPAYCLQHRVAQEDLSEEERRKLKVKPVDTCCICYDPVETRASGSVILAPCCTRAFYHRQCLEDMAHSAGLHYFKCPLCNNLTEWQSEMLQNGIYIPDRDASWELEPNAYNSLLEAHMECESEICLCPRGRKEDKPDSKWELILCETCGSQACHAPCGKLKRRDKEWLCKLCRNSTDHTADYTADHTADYTAETDYSDAETKGCISPALSGAFTPARASRKRQLVSTPRRGRDRQAPSDRPHGIREVTNLMLNNSLTP